ncbi:MAG TPA: BamA/TamA family outer membrane protein [Gemmatimonadaceae bacterium]|nr:BamA/TamA family outer membrane protein [Gemmatimonadaceae bacterium]
MRRSLATAAALLAGLATAAAPLAAQEYFGTNQVQYETFDWKVLETEHFQVHFYPGLEKTARIAGSMAERSYARLSRILGHEFREKKPIIVFASRTDFAQNNMFGDLGESTGGVTDWLRQRNTIYFLGDYGEFEHVLTHEMVHVFEYDVFSRGRAGSNLQSFARARPPDWFMEGMAEYLSRGPDHPPTDAVVRDAALNGRLPTIEEMTYRPDLYFPYRYGEALWEYVGQRWGDRAIGDILNGAPSVGIERSFQRELGLSLEQLGEEWRESVQDTQLPQIAERQRARRFAEPLLDAERTGGASHNYVAPTLSPDGQYVAFLSTGSYLRGEVFPDLYLAETKTGERVARLTKSTRSPEFEELRIGYSQAAFSPDGKYLAFTAQRRGKDILVLLDVKRRKEVRAFDKFPFEQMIGPTFSPDGRRIAFVGATGEQSDLYVMNVDGSGLRQLTDDLYGDAQPAWSPDGRWIAFASERGPQTDLSLLRFGKWRISLLDLSTGRVEVLPGQDGRNLNPQWSPDSRDLVYISDRTGTSNLFLYDIAEREHYQLSDVFSSVASFTEISPAISWARNADKLAFVYFEDNEYSVWWISNPRHLKGEPFREPAPATRVVATADSSIVPQAAVDTLAPSAADSALHAARPGQVAQGAPHSVLLDTLPEQLSIYRSASGLRHSETLPPAERGRTDAVTVAALLDSASLALPDTSTFRVYDYSGGLRPEAVSQPTIGYAQDNFNRGIVGGTTVIFSDLLGNHRLALAGAVNGRLSEAQVFAAYANYAHRLQYVLGVSQMPYYFQSGFVQVAPITQTEDLETRAFFRYIVREAFAVGMRPKDRFTRFEFGARGLSYARDEIRFARYIDHATGFALTDYFYQPIRRLPSVNVVAPFGAYVSDNALMGYTSPILGRRYRLQVSPNFGTWNYVEYLADYRRYDPILFNVLTVATRFTGIARIGKDENQLPPNYLRPEFIRGYDDQFYRNRTCSPTREAECVSSFELVGSRVAFANAELRFPVIRRFDLGILPISLPPVDGHLFYDAGIAWTDGQHASFSTAQSPEANTRTLLTSWGAGFRLNLFGYAILRMDYAIPLATPDHRGRWTWLIGGYGF